MTIPIALAVTAAVLLPGVAFIAARLAFTTWRRNRRAMARQVRIIDSALGMSTTGQER